MDKSYEWINRTTLKDVDYTDGNCLMSYDLEIIRSLTEDDYNWGLKLDR